MNTSNVTRTVERALDILECFTEENYELGISEIAKKIDLPKATAYRILKTLQARGYVTQNMDTAKYRLDAAVLQRSQIFLSRLDIRSIALPYMQDIREQLNETVNLYIPNKGRRVCIERVESTQPLKSTTKVGDTLPLEKGAAGKVLLAFGTSAENSVDELELNNIRRQGYAVGHGERATGLSSVAAPIFDHRGIIIASIAVAGPTARFTGDTLSKIISIAVMNASEISKRLGYQ